MKEVQIIRCNWCEHVFPEDALCIDDDIESCPDCDQVDCLMNLGRFGVDEDESLFPHLSKAKDWKALKTHFSIDILCDFENEIHDYEMSMGVYSEDVDDYPTIIQWWEGLMDTSELIETYA